MSRSGGKATASEMSTAEAHPRRRYKRDRRESVLLQCELRVLSLSGADRAGPLAAGDVDEGEVVIRLAL
jgi:hypothetical protein